MNPTISDKDRGRNILAAIRTLRDVEADDRAATDEEREILSRFGGFGAVALRIFPDPITGAYHDATWAAMGDELRSLLTDEEYDSAKRTTFTAFYTSPIVMRALFAALDRVGVSPMARVLEPGAGIGNFMAHAPAGMRFVGVEMDSISGRIARLIHPDHEIRVEDFRDTILDGGSFDAAIGNPPFGDVKTKYGKHKLSLADYFLVKSLDGLRPGGILAMVTSHFTLDRRDSAARRAMAERADFIGAVRLPSSAFKGEGTEVVADLVFFRKRSKGQPAAHVARWLDVASVDVDGSPVPINDYFVDHPEMILGTLTRQDTLYGGDQSYSVLPSGDLESGLNTCLASLPQFVQSDILGFTPIEVEPRPRLMDSPAGEGRFSIAPDRTIMQVVHGRPSPVVYGGIRLKSDGTMTGKRMAALIRLRDHARAVLASQNAGAPTSRREEDRECLNGSYDRFVAAYGPINRTTVGESSDGSVTRRMPNLVKFREDPDAMLVMALEDYDELTDTAAKSPIMLRDVVGPRPPLTRVDSAEAGLLASLDRLGAVDLEYIAGLYGKPAESVAVELGDLIYRDPVDGRWETSDTYLSGNVRARLAVAESAGPDYARNVEALGAVQPEDILPGDIDVNLGAPWVPAADISEFASALFSVPAGSIKVGHLKKDAVWSVDADYRAIYSVAVTSDYGTSRIDGIRLLDQCLNMKTATIYDVEINAEGNEVRVLNQVETMAAREKQRAIKDRFKLWAFADDARSDRLVRIYNDTYNNIRLRTFDGSHLEFPGMSKAVTLNPHQKDGVWRIMSGGNTLLAHIVGSGKTWIMCAAAMKMKSAGIINKPLFVVPNHILEQFAREFMHLYPDAKLLVATKDDLARERRKALTAKIAGGEWDGIIITHSSFERIAMSDRFQVDFVRDQIRLYEDLMIDVRSQDGYRANRNIIKTIEKQKLKREDRLKQLLARDKKDDGLVFDELGVDHIFIDEAHYFKNLETPTKMERVAGIQTTGSERSFDLFMKCCYLHRKHPGHGVTFATGTPISNTMVEMYTMQRFLDPDGLAEREIEHFDAWAATFGEVVETMEISPDGATLRPRSRFARFVNIPELVQLFRSFSDVQTSDMLDLPRPKLAGGKPETIARPMSDLQRSLQKDLVRRYERIRSEKVDPREDNALSITTDGRKLALDARMLSHADDFPDSKVNAAVENILRIWRETSSIRGTQLVFCDLGVHARPHGVYDDVVEKLVTAGIPSSQVYVMGDADTDAKKRSLFDRVNAGAVRVLIGSTGKMGTGTNVQRRLISLHHLDAPWKPAEVEQREGRILRQGNGNAEVSIYRYVTQGSFDAFMWQALETKARFISQVVTGRVAVRKAEDVGGQELSYAEVKAIASGNPAVLTLAETDAELQRMAILRKNHVDQQYLTRKNLATLPDKIAGMDLRIARLSEDVESLDARREDPVTIGSAAHRRDKLQSPLGAWMESLPPRVKSVERFPIGTYRGLEWGLIMRPFSGSEVYLEGKATSRQALTMQNPGPRALLNAIDRIVDNYEWEISILKRDVEMARRQLADYSDRSESTFAHADYMDRLTALRDRLRMALSDSAMASESGPEQLAAVVVEVEQLRASNRPDDVVTEPRRVVDRSSEESVVSRIRRRATTDTPAVVGDRRDDVTPAPRRRPRRA